MTLALRHRLKSRTAIKELMEKGERTKVYPIRMVYRLVGPVSGEEQEHYPDSPLRLGISVPKRLHKRAVDRNLIKRRLSAMSGEVMGPLVTQLSESGLRLEIMIIYMSTEKLDTAALRPKITLLFERLYTCIPNPPIAP